MAEENIEIQRGSGNVFEDLGFPDAAEMQEKVDIAHQIRQATAHRRLKEREAAEKMGVSIDEARSISTSSVFNFSVDRLQEMLGKVRQSE